MGTEGLSPNERMFENNWDEYEYESGGGLRERSRRRRFLASRCFDFHDPEEDILEGIELEFFSFVSKFPYLEEHLKSFGFEERENFLRFLENNPNHLIKLINNEDILKDIYENKRDYFMKMIYSPRVLNREISMRNYFREEKGRIGSQEFLGLPIIEQIKIIKKRPHEEIEKQERLSNHYLKLLGIDTRVSKEFREEKEVETYIDGENGRIEKNKFNQFVDFKIIFITTTVSEEVKEIRIYGMVKILSFEFEAIDKKQMS